MFTLSGPGTSRIPGAAAQTQCNSVSYKGKLRPKKVQQVSSHNDLVAKVGLEKGAELSRPASWLGALSGLS